jgi:solute:Na+ symporter, SSS family
MLVAGPGPVPLTLTDRLTHLQQEATAAFRGRFGVPPTLWVAAPGRVNLIGEHVDYNDGFVMPMAIERHVLIAAAPTPEPLAAFHSTAQNEAATIPLAARLTPGQPAWANYPRGVIAGFQSLAQPLHGFAALVHGDLPLGGGLSSSAALEVATCRLLEALNQRELTDLERIRLCQQAEHEFAGVPCGIMDQFIVTTARADHALLLDCQSLVAQHVPLASDQVAFLITHCGVAHELARGEYAHRRASCQLVARSLGLSSLRLATPDQLEAARPLLDPVGRPPQKPACEKSSEGYFLAGRGLHWWLIGFSLIAANISTEQFVGMSGNAASHVGLAIASYEWMAAITLVIVGFGFLPYFLRAGIFTMPEFLEYRYNGAARTIMAVATILIYLLLLGSVTYSGALTISSLAGKAGPQPRLRPSPGPGHRLADHRLRRHALRRRRRPQGLRLGRPHPGQRPDPRRHPHHVLRLPKLGVATEAAAVVDIQTGAVAVQSLAPDAGAVERFWSLNKPRMNMFLPASDSVLPWTALLLGLWIPNFYYWGLNQYITQRTLGSASLAQGQRGIVFAAFMKLLIPFVIVIPGIIAFNLYSEQMRLEAVNDRAPVIAKYLKANPQTAFRRIGHRTNPTEARIAAWPSGRYLIALYPTEHRSPRPAPPTPRSSPDSGRPPTKPSTRPFTLFLTEDASWRHVNPASPRKSNTQRAPSPRPPPPPPIKNPGRKLIAYKYDTALAQLLGHVLPRASAWSASSSPPCSARSSVPWPPCSMPPPPSSPWTSSNATSPLRPTRKSIVLLGRVSVVVFAACRHLPRPAARQPQNQQQHLHHHPGRTGLHFTRHPGRLHLRPARASRPAHLRRGGPPHQHRRLRRAQTRRARLQFLNRMAVCFAFCLAIMIP